MASYTPNYNLLKVGPDDLIDAQSQMVRNLEIIDDAGFRAANYRIFNVPFAALPLNGNRLGDKIYNHYDGAIYVWGGTGWAMSALSSCATMDWQDITLSAGFENVGGNNYNLGWKYHINGPPGAQPSIRFRGRIRQTGYAVFARGTAVNCTAVGAFPGAVTSKNVNASTGGNGPRFFRLSLSNQGQLQACYSSDADMTPGSNANYIDLSGISMPLT